MDVAPECTASPHNLSLGRPSPVSLASFVVSSHLDTNERPFPPAPQLPLRALKGASWWSLSFHVTLHLGKPSLGGAEGLAQVTSSEVATPGLDRAL